MSLQERLIPARGLKAQLQGFAALGLDVPTMLRLMAVGDLDALSQPGSLVHTGAFLRMWESARQQDARPGLPTALAQAIPFGSFGLIDYLVGSSESVAGAMHSLTMHFRLATYQARIELEKSDEQRWIRMRPTEALSDDAGEFMTMSILHRLRTLTDGALRVPEVHLTRSRPATLGLYDSLPDTRFEFSAPVAAFAIAEESWQLPVNRADPQLRDTLAHIASGLHLDVGSRINIEIALRARLRDALAGQMADPATLAKLLGVSERTLQRRLGEHGLSFSAVVESFRHEEALRLLNATAHPLAEIAARLGFQEQSSFTRAFRRWTRTTPAAWRSARRKESAT
jgi:AraC-like DNA-binding protein